MASASGRLELPATSFIGRLVGKNGTPQVTDAGTRRRPPAPRF
jgi:hypothetical protein